MPMPNHHARAACGGALRRLLVVCTLVMSTPACGSDSSDDASSSSGGGSTGEGGHYAGPPEDPNAVVGTFEIEVVEADPGRGVEASATLFGKVYDAPTPSQLVWELATESGDCKLSKPRVPFCSTPCGGSAVCVEDDTCKPYPTAYSVGDVTVTGARDSDRNTSFTMSPVANNYQKTLAYPPFSEGDSVALSASGAYFSAFELAGKGISTFSLTSTSLVLDSEAPLALAWKAASDAKASRIYVKLDISHHGGTKGMIECETDDDGSMEIGEELVAALLDLGFAGYPTVIVSRKNVASVSIEAGVVRLVLASEVEHAVEIDGLVSCSNSSQCPDGQTCQDNLICQ